MSAVLSRRRLFKAAGAGLLGGALAACGATPTPQVIKEVVTQVVEKEVTKIVEGTSVVEVVKETVVVEQTVVVEKEKVVEATAEKVTLRYGVYSGWWVDTYKSELFPPFTEEYPNIEVQVEDAPWEQYWPRFESQAAAGIAPDLQIGDPFKIARYCDKGIYLATQPFIDRDGVDLKAYVPVALEACYYDVATGLVGQGVIYGFPSTYVGTVLYYNKDLFDAAGVAYPTDEWTRVEFQDAATKLTKDKSGKRADEAGFDPQSVDVYGVSTIGGYSTATHLWNNGGGLVSEDGRECWISKPESVEIFQWLGDLINKHYVNPPTVWFEGQPDVFLTQKIGMKLDGTWNVDFYCTEAKDFKFDIANPPLGTAGLPRVTYSGTNTNHIYSQTKHQEESWTCLNWLAGPGGMTFYSTMGPPGLISIAESVYKKGACPEHRAVASDIGNYSHNYYPNRGNDRWKEIYNQLIQAVYLDQASAAEVCAGICEKVQPILDEVAAQA